MPAPTVPPVNILLADDDVDDRFFFERALTRISVSTTLKTVNDGEKLLKELNNAQDLPDALFLDLNMPRRNGNECLSEIRGNSRFRKIHIVIYSTSCYDAVADVLYKNGAYLYFQKCEFKPLVQSLEIILNAIRNKEGRPSRENFIFSLNKIISSR